MRAILLAAGYGKRLGNLTKSKPKCLLPVNGKPLLEHWISKLLKAKITKILINTHYKYDQVERFIKNSKYKKKIILSHEKNLLGTGKTLYKNIDFFKNRDGMLIHADNYVQENIKNFINYYKKNKKCKISLIAFKTNNYKESGILKINEKNILTRIYEKKNKKYGTLANGAVYIISSKCLEEIKKRNLNKKDFTKNILPKFLGQISVYKTKKIFTDIGNKYRYKNLNSILKHD